MKICLQINHLFSYIQTQRKQIKISIETLFVFERWPALVKREKLPQTKSAVEYQGWRVYYQLTTWMIACGCMNPTICEWVQNDSQLIVIPCNHDRFACSAWSSSENHSTWLLLCVSEIEVFLKWFFFSLYCSFVELVKLISVTIQGIKSHMER